MTRIAVIGGGYAGAAFAVHLSRMAGRPLEITVVEPREQVGGGMAYSTPDPDHRLNAPDVIHFLYPDDDLHFRRFLQKSGRLAKDPEALHKDERLYPRRGDFGAYVASEFAAHAVSNRSNSTLSHRRGRAVGVERRGGGLRIELADGESMEAERCIVTLGHDLAPARLDPRIEWERSHGITDRTVRAALELIAEREDEIRSLQSIEHAEDYPLVSRVHSEGSPSNQ